jgi:hypothetical protein
MWASVVYSLLLAGRFAVIATAGEATGELPLRYVDADAERVGSVLEELGGFPADHIVRVRHREQVR